MNTFNLTIITPKAILVETKAIALGATGSEGDFTALPGHVAFLAILKIGLLWYRTPDNGEKKLAISGGFAEILPEKIVILADSAEFIETIDLERAMEAKARADKRITEAKKELQEPDHETNIDLFRAELSLHKAVNRIKLAGNISKK